MNSTDQKTNEPALINAESANNEITQKICGACQEIFPANKDFFCSNIGAPDGLYSKCHKCRRSKSKRDEFVTRCRKCLRLKSNDYFSGSRTTCRKCRGKRSYEILDKIKAKQNHAKWRSENKEHVRNNNKAWKGKNKSKVTESNKKYSMTDRAKQLRKSSAKNRYDKNPEHYRAKACMYDKRVRSASPSWYESEKDLIKVVYKKANQLGFQVDHIVPISSSMVCGLHTWANLQLLDGLINKAKGNRVWPDMP